MVETSKPFLYQVSSQNKRWRLSSKRIEELRQVQFNKAKEAYEKIKQEKLNELKDNEKADKIKGLSYFNIEDEQKVLIYYQNKLAGLVEYFKMPIVVFQTSSVFFRRFYLYSHTSEFNVMNIVYTCLFLACKVENHYISLEKFCVALKVQQEEITNLEFIVAQRLNFDFKVHHTSLPLFGITLDCQNLEAINVKALSEAYKDAADKLKQLLFFDVIFLANPSQLALAVFKLVSSGYNLDVEGYLKSTFGKDYDELNAIIDQLIPEIQKYLKSDKESINKGRALSKQYDFVLNYTKGQTKINPES